MLIYCYSTHTIVIGAHSTSSSYCVSFAQHKCFIDKNTKKNKQKKNDVFFCCEHKINEKKIEDPAGISA